MNRHPNAHASAGAYSNASQVAMHLTQHGQQARQKAVRLVRFHGLLLETRIKAAASGRPGPRVITGDYRRSWNTRVQQSSGGVTATVGSNAPQGPRLEYGFVGADRLGRVYDQPPFPHVAGPAQLTMREFLDAIRREQW